jgi:aspartate carbamoyltransferase catalytic subunit
MPLPDAEALCVALADAMRGHIDPAATVLVGIHTGGVWVAERLHAALGLKIAPGSIDVSFYRDDYSQRGLHANAKTSQIPFDVEGAHIVIVDDVLYTGRTIRAAMNELFDYGRPAKIELAVLAQLNQPRRTQHLLTIEGLPREVLTRILDTAAPFTEVAEREVKKVPLLRGKSVFNLFFENSTRTRTTFEIAAKRLSADVINLNISTSSPTRARPCSTRWTTSPRCRPTCSSCAMRLERRALPDRAAPRRHRARPHPRHQCRRRPPCAHPTQGLLDMYTIRHYKKDFSQPHRGHRRRRAAFARGAQPDPRADHPGRARKCASSRPRPCCRPDVERLGVRVFHDMSEGLRGVDVVMMLRLQNERMQGALLPSPTQEYFKSYGLTPEKLALAKPDAIVMHPGPMNRGVEIDSAVADGGRP